MGNLSRDEETEIQLNEMQIIHFHLFFNYFVALFSVDGAFVSVISELLDISTPNSTKKYQEGHKSQIFSQNLKSGNTEVAFMLRVLRKLEANLHSTLQMVWKKEEQKKTFVAQNYPCFFKFSRTAENDSTWFFMGISMQALLDWIF